MSNVNQVDRDHHVVELALEPSVQHKHALAVDLDGLDQIDIDLKTFLDQPAPFSTDGKPLELTLDLICFSHRHWDGVTDRPHHLLTRCARERRVFFWEPAVFEEQSLPRIEVIEAQPQLWIVKPHLPACASPALAQSMQRELLDDFLADYDVASLIRWYETPLALAFSSHLDADATIYDCVEDIGRLPGSPAELKRLEQELLTAADLVFASGMSLYESKRRQHAAVHVFPGSVDVAHFATARRGGADPADQAAIAHPRAGYIGVLDQRLDWPLIGELARLRPESHFIFIGPVRDIDPAALPQAANLHFLGPKSYAELPQYLAGWDVALVPYAVNTANRFLCSNTTSEYLAAGKPVVSTPIQDMMRGYGNAGLVCIAACAEEFAAAVDGAIASQRAHAPHIASWLTAVDEKLAGRSWDRTWSEMWAQIERVRRRSASFSIEPPIAAFRSATYTPTAYRSTKVLQQSGMKTPTAAHARRWQW